MWSKIVPVLKATLLCGLLRFALLENTTNVFVHDIGASILSRHYLSGEFVVIKPGSCEHKQEISSFCVVIQRPSPFLDSADPLPRLSPYTDRGSNDNERINGPQLKES